MKLNAEHGLGTGLGDCVMLCWFADATFFVQNDKKKQIFNLFGKQHDSNKRYRGCKIEPAFHHDLANMQTQARLTSWAEALKINKIKRPTAHISEQSHEWALNINKRNIKPIMLFPKSNVKSREWPPNYWHDLTWKLKDAGEYPIVMLAEEDSAFRKTPSYWYGYSIEHISAMMKQAKLVISNDSFAAHLAGTLDVKTLALLGPTTKTVYEHLPSVNTLHTKRISCAGCCFKHPFRGACDLGCFALYGLFVEDVLDEIKRLTQQKSTCTMVA